MELTQVSRFSRDELFAALRQVRLRGYGGARPYANAHIELVDALDTDRVAPAQNYVLRDSVELILALRRRLADWDVDPFSLSGGVTIQTAEDPAGPRTLIPPIIEESVEDGQRVVWLISDGMHRVYAARSVGLGITAVLITNVAYPYYAFPIDDGWAGITELDRLPEVHQKKVYRQPDNYKALFRDFNAVFPGVQQPRARSNPSFLRPGE